MMGTRNFVYETSQGDPAGCILQGWIYDKIFAEVWVDLLMQNGGEVY